MGHVMANYAANVVFRGSAHFRSKTANSAAQLEIPPPTENCGPSHQHTLYTCSPAGRLHQTNTLVASGSKHHKGPMLQTAAQHYSP